MTLAEFIQALGGELIGDGSIDVRQVNTLARAGGTDISFLTNSRYRGQLAASRAAAFILGTKDREATDRPRIISDNPYLYFARVSRLLNPGRAYVAGVSPGASVGNDVKIDATAHIAADASIGDQSHIGARSVVLSGARIGERVTIGDDCIVYPNAVVYDGCTIGNRVILHSGCVIGADGFGMANDGGRWVKIPQIGAVIIHDDVEVGANTTIDRGALEDTILEEGVKLDNQIQIGHNCVIGAHTAIAGCVGIAGSTRIGRHCTIAGAAKILGHLEICDGVQISTDTLISRSIHQPGVWTGMMPASVHEEWLKNASQLRHLAEMRERIQQLEKKLADMERKNT